MIWIHVKFSLICSLAGFATEFTDRRAAEGHMSKLIDICFQKNAVHPRICRIALPFSPLG